MHIKEFEYNLPEEQIALRPAEKREDSRLMVLDRKTGNITHRHFYDILEYLNPGDCLVLNDSKVIPARLYGYRLLVGDASGWTAEKQGCGARVELLLLKHMEGDTWQAMVRPGKKLRTGDRAIFFFGDKPMLMAEIKGYGEDGTRLVAFEYEGTGPAGGPGFYEILDKIGSMPLPPYIRRANEPEDTSRYQTVYCRENGSAAAPTAGLHFTGGLLEAARDKGVKTAFVTLHVGLGTFRPVKCERIEEHKMHFERYSIDAQNASLINEAKEHGGRVICVGTTSARTLESAAVRCEGADGRTDGEKTARADWCVEPGSGETGIFIYPGYPFKMTDALITNFHLPGSTLLMLVSALYNREKILAAYEEAIHQKYRFFSYGDAMLIL